MRFTSVRGALALLTCALFVSCSEMPFSPRTPVTPLQPTVVTPPQVVISQIYGGGGLVGSQYLNDFVELFNPGASTVDVTGWSVQYASATSTNWSVTNLTGSIAPGGYYLIQLASSLLGSVELPTPDAVGTTNLNASNGKVALLSSTTRIASGTACPAGVVDFVAYGTAASGIACAALTGTSLTPSTAAIRLGDGCTYTGTNAADFTTDVPTPRNGESVTHSCGNGQPANTPPVAVIDGPYTGAEGTTSIALSGAGSSATNGTIVSYAWNFGDGMTGSGANVTHTYAQDGTFTVTLVVTDNNGLIGTITTTATIANVAPNVAAMNDVTLLLGEAYSASGSFTDPGADSWSATVSYGDDSGTKALSLNGQGFSWSHVYVVPGSFTVTVSVADDDVTSARTHTVVVLSLLQAIDSALALVDQMVAAGKLKPNPYRNNLETARKLFVMNKAANAWAPLQNLLLELNSAVQSGKVSAQDSDALKLLVTRIVESIT